MGYLFMKDIDISKLPVSKAGIRDSYLISNFAF
jgi:hypothetical protein